MPELRAFLEEQLANPYNKYCLDCKKNQTTHAIVWLGVFVCKDCADLHKVTFGGNQYSYIKDVYGEQWDDYQLRSVCFGGNQALFQILKEYGIDNHPLSSKYRHAAVTWYRRRHLAQMDGVPFDMESNPKPPKDFEERMAQTKAQLLKKAGNAGEDFKIVGSLVTENASHAGRVISENAKSLFESGNAKAIGEKA